MEARSWQYLNNLQKKRKNFYDWQVGNGSGYRVIIDEKEWKTGNKKLRKVEKLWD